jgi:hypothetical protein
LQIGADDACHVLAHEEQSANDDGNVGAYAKQPFMLESKGPPQTILQIAHGRSAYMFESL